MTDESTPTIRRYDWEDVTPSVAIVETVSDAANVGPIDLPTLNDVIDTDALDMIFANVTRETELTLSFVYAGREVTLLGDGTVIVD